MGLGAEDVVEGCAECALTLRNGAHGKRDRGIYNIMT